MRAGLPVDMGIFAGLLAGSGSYTVVDHHPLQDDDHVHLFVYRRETEIHERGDMDASEREGGGREVSDSGSASHSQLEHIHLGHDHGPHDTVIHRLLSGAYRDLPLRSSHIQREVHQIQPDCCGVCGCRADSDAHTLRSAAGSSPRIGIHMGDLLSYQKVQQESAAGRTRI